MVEHGRQHIGQESELPDLADRQCERHADRFLGPAQRNQAFDAAPLVDGVERLAGDVFHHRAHCTVVVGSFDDEDGDFLHSRCDSLLHAAVSGLDDVAIATVDFR